MEQKLQVIVLKASTKEKPLTDLEKITPSGFYIKEHNIYYTNGGESLCISILFEKIKI
jgi:hypothetical protein